MTAKIISLKQARKQRQRAEKEKTSATARQKHGRSKAEKQRDKLDHQKNIRHLDGHHLDGQKDD